MRIALTGANGQLGTQLQLTLTGDVIPLGRDQLDIGDAEAVESVLDSRKPDVVINTAAYNLVDRAEEEPQLAYSDNALGPRNLALFCKKREIPLLHFSTDFVFSGRDGDPGNSMQPNRPYLETDLPSPESAYAVSKLAGEYFVRTLCDRHFVVRTCGLYGNPRQPGTGNFVETMLRLGTERDELTIVNDQCCTPTSCSDLADAVGSLIETDSFGLYHATNSGSTTWYEFAMKIFRLSGIDVAVRPISSEQFGAAARRPVYSVLDNEKLSSVLGRELPDWQDSLDRYLKQRDV